MLVLSRKLSEEIVINEDITIMVVGIRGDKVRLGIVADKDVPIYRREVLDAIKRERKSEAELAGVEYVDVPVPCGGKLSPSSREKFIRESREASPHA